MIISTGEQKQKKLARDCAIAQDQYQDKSILNELYQKYSVQVEMNSKGVSKSKLQT